MSKWEHTPKLKWIKGVRDRLLPGASALYRSLSGPLPCWGPNSCNLPRNLTCSSLNRVSYLLRLLLTSAYGIMNTFTLALHVASSFSCPNRRCYFKGSHYCAGYIHIFNHKRKHYIYWILLRATILTIIVLYRSYWRSFYTTRLWFF